MFEFLRPDKSPPNARKPKRKKAKNLHKEQPTHTPHPHNEKAPRSFHEYTPKFRNALKSKVSDYLKRPSEFPPTQQSTPKFRNAPKSKVSGYIKRPSKFPFTHEVRGFRTIQRPNTPQPNTPRSLLGSLIASKIRTFQGQFLHLGGLDRPPPAPPRTGGNPSVCVPKNA